MLVIALVACLSGEPKCGVVSIYKTSAACETAKTFIQQRSPIEWLPLHCEERLPEKQT